MKARPGCRLIGKTPTAATVLALLFLGAVHFLAIGCGNRSDEPETTSSPEPTSAPGPGTSAPESTSSPEPTSAPVPTSTPELTPTPFPELITCSTPSPEQPYPDQDHDSYPDSEDCNDTDPSIHPGAPEVCNGKDEDCDGKIDEGSFFVDTDGDGHGYPNSPPKTCPAPAGYVSSSDDCDDSARATYPGAPEACNEKDDNCDGRVDEDCARIFPDLDDDGFGVEGLDPADFDPSVLVAARGDCDDRDAARYPGAVDFPGDGIDQDCGGSACTDVHVGLTSDSYPSIQAAIDAASDGQTIWVGPATYLEHNVNLRGKAIKLKATVNGAATLAPPLIYSDSPHRQNGFVIDAGESASTLLDGFAVYAGQVGVTVTGSSPSLRNLIVVSSYPTGILMSSSSSTLENITINASSYSGLKVSSSTIRLTGCQFLRNWSFDGGGGGVQVKASTVWMTDCVIAENASSQEGGGAGGGLYLYDSTAHLTRCAITGNILSNSFVCELWEGAGGGVYMKSSTASLDGCDISGNDAGYETTGCPFPPHQSSYVCGGHGGGIEATAHSSLTITNSSLTGNKSIRGGGIYVKDSSAYLFHTLLAGNQARTTSHPDSGTLENGQGGGLSLVNATGSIDYCRIAGNSAYFGGGVDLEESGQIDFHHDLVTGNEVKGAQMRTDAGDITYGNAGGGFYGSSSDSTINGSIIALNTPDNLFQKSSSSRGLQLTWSDLYNAAGNPNHNLSSLDTSVLTVEPQLMSDGRHLSVTSPLIGAGDPEESDPDGSRCDQGVFGGAEGGDTDIDGDGYPDWFWPGTITDAPAGFAASQFDCDDLDGSRSQCGELGERIPWLDLAAESNLTTASIFASRPIGVALASQ